MRSIILNNKFMAKVNKIFMTPLEAWRRKHKLSYMKMGQKLGESHTVTFNWCKGKSLPRSRKWKQIAKLTGLSQQQIAGISP